MKKNLQSGQVMVPFAFLMVILIIMSGLVIDGALFFLEKRAAQNAADLGAMAGAFAKCSGGDLDSMVLTIADENGYDNNGATNTVGVYSPPIDGHYKDNSGYIQVNVNSEITPKFMQIIAPGNLEIGARAVSLCDKTGASNASGLPPQDFSVMGGDASCKKDPIRFSGVDNTIDGPMHSNDTIMISGTNNFNGPVTDGSDAVYDWPLDAFDIDDYKLGGYYHLSDPNYHYSNDKWSWIGNNITIPDGIYVAKNEINVGGDNITGNVTFVVLDEDASISFGGGPHALTPYHEGLLAFAPGDKCTTEAIKVNGNDTNYEGILYTPNGEIHMSGTGLFTISGCLWGARVNFSGNKMWVGNCGDYFPTSEITLIE